MQQTDKYKLNLIERDDVFSPDALNENTQKVEDVLSAEAAARAAEAEARGALAQRVTRLEAHKVYWGTYKGDGAGAQTINLGFTPQALYATDKSTTAHHGFIVGLDMVLTVGVYDAAKIVEGGFEVYNSGIFNQANHTYCYFAFV